MDQETLVRFPAETIYRVGTQMERGYNDVFGRPGAIVHRGRLSMLKSKDHTATHGIVSREQVNIICPVTEQAEMSLNVTLNHNTSKLYLVSTNDVVIVQSLW